MTRSQILITEMSFHLPTGLSLFKHINLNLAQQKIGLVGKNGIGKSTLLKLIAGELQPSTGSIQVARKIAFVQQNPYLPSDTTIAGFLGYEDKLQALFAIEQGSSNPDHFSILNDDWMVKERLQESLTMFGLKTLPFSLKLNELSGGELTKICLTKAFTSPCDFLLLDEPTNHLDINTREKLYRVICEWQGGILVVSHDRTLLNLMDEIIELSSLGIVSFGGNYDAYKEQKHILSDAKEKRFLDAKKHLEKTKKSIQLTKEKHEQRQAKGRTLRKRGDQPKMLLDTMENSSTASQGSLLTRHTRMLETASKKLLLAKSKIELIDEIHVELPDTYIPNGKVVLEIENLKFSYSAINNPIINNFNLKILGKERIALSGGNGSGKTTLIRLILNHLQPTQGKIYLGTERISYLDQNVNLLNEEMSILENFLQINPNAKENDAYKALAKFLFKNIATLNLVKNLSGGEKLRASLACTLLSFNPPQLLILDEPTNHLDIQSMASIESALKYYQGAMIVISHDQAFLKAIEIGRTIYAPFINLK